MRTIGISNKTRYWQHYVFSHPPVGYRYKRGWDVPWHRTPVSNWFVLHTKWFALPWKFDLFHTYNGILVNDRPWVVEVESHFPRFGPMQQTHPLYRWGLRRLAGRDCKWIIYTSDHARLNNMDKLTAAGVDPTKLKVVYRAVEQYEPLPMERQAFTIIFAGNGFYRKGGVELLKAFQRLDRADARLVLVSSLEVDWAVRPDAATVSWVERTIREDPRIELHSQLPHHSVMQLMRRAHVFVSTTYADPFNNTVLEAMGARLPIISSRTSSIPEMVQDGGNGWLLDVAGIPGDTIADQIAARLGQLMDDPALLERMGIQSHRIVREKFDIRVRNERLKELYDMALDGR